MEEVISQTPENVVLDAPKPVLVSVDVNGLLEKKRKEYAEIRGQIQSVADQQQKVQQEAQQKHSELQKVRDSLLTVGLEIQGVIKELEKLVPTESK